MEGEMNQTGSNPIVFLTDFGREDVFAGVMKGVIAAIAPDTKVIDLSHGVLPQNILNGSFLLSQSVPYFPRGSIFCVVVDPGVGSDRKGICIRTKDYYFVGPDNGVLWHAASRNGICEITDLTNTDYFLSKVSRTFHGRDIFAPVAAHISKGLEDLNVFGKPLERCERLDLPEPTHENGRLHLTVLHIDGFGNVTLNLTENRFRQFVRDGKFILRFNAFSINTCCETYASAPDEELFLIPASGPYLEISVKNGSAAEVLSAHVMDSAVLESAGN